MHPKHSEFLGRIAHQEALLRRMLAEQRAALAKAMDRDADAVAGLQTLISLNERSLALLETSGSQLDRLDDDRWNIIAGIKE